jgi:hypothetical protein
MIIIMAELKQSPLCPQASKSRRVPVILATQEGEIRRIMV